MAGLRVRKCTRVEPVADRPLVAGQIRIVQDVRAQYHVGRIAGRIRYADGILALPQRRQKLPSLEREDAADRPSAGEQVSQARGIREEVFAPPERQLVNVVQIEPMRRDVLRWANFP